MSMSNHNLEIEAPRWLAFWSDAPDALAEGYDMCIYEYTNDMSARELIEQHRDHPLIQMQSSEIERIDNRLISILRPTKKCIHGDYPKSHFWFWSYPPNSPELERDLQEIGAI